jgi:hypothetical protein
MVLTGCTVDTTARMWNQDVDASDRMWIVLSRCGGL